MRTLLWAEGLKLKRSKILWLALFAVILVALVVYLQGQFIYYGKRYVDTVAWYMTATQSLGSLYVFPALIALLGSYIICREEQEDTWKGLALIPVNLGDLLRAKLIITAVFALALYALLYVIALCVEVLLHKALLDWGMVLNYAKIYLLDGICLFLAVSPIIAFVSKLKKSYWLALLFAEVYSFLGLFFGMESTLRCIYPITAAFSVAGYYETTPGQFVISLLSLLSCGGITMGIMYGLKLNLLTVRKQGGLSLKP